MTSVLNSSCPRYSLYDLDCTQCVWKDTKVEMREMCKTGGRVSEFRLKTQMSQTFGLICNGKEVLGYELLLKL